MRATEVYRQAIKRTFADLYGVGRHEVDVSWDGDNITVRYADKTFTHDTIDEDDDSTLEFVSNREGCVTVRLNNEERRRLERTDLGRVTAIETADLSLGQSAALPRHEALAPFRNGLPPFGEGEKKSRSNSHN